MQTNQYNKIIGSKINALSEAANSENIDFTATWQKLENTLHKKPRKIIPTYYWSAASAIVLFCSIYFLSNPFKNTKQNNGVVQVTHPTSTTIKKNAHTAVSASNILPETTNQQNVVSTKEKIAAHKMVTVDSGTENKYEQTFTHPITTTAAQINGTKNVISTIITPEQPNIQTSLLPTKVNTRSKRKIYHISELGFVMEEQNFADNKKLNKKQVLKEEEHTTEPPKSFWQLKAKPVTTALTTLSDDQ